MTFWVANYTRGGWPGVANNTLEILYFTREAGKLIIEVIIFFVT